MDVSMASTIRFFILIIIFVNGGEFFQYHNKDDSFWTFLKQIVEGLSTNKDTTSDDETYHTAKENDKVNDIMRNDILETRKLHVEKLKPNVENVSILMPGVRPSKMDTYFCTGYKLPENTTYIVGYHPSAEMNIAHHMLLFGCENLPTREKVWNCGNMGTPCAHGRQSIMYAWGRDAPLLKMDSDVGMKVAGNTGFKYLILQVHYLNVSTFKDPTTKDSSGVIVMFDTNKKSKLAGIYFIGAGWPPIPPNKKEFFMYMGCEYGKGPTFHPFRYRVHAHSLGRMISAYRIRDDIWTLIGRRDPLKPQAFYEVADNSMDVRPGDTLIGRCTYNSEARNRTTYIGATHSDEMCNFYIMYYYDSTKPGSVDQGGCRTPKAKYFWKYPGDHIVV